MLHITRKGDYAIRGMVYLATRPMNRMSLISEMASGIDVSQTILAKIFQNLGKVGLVKSSRGMGGGFTLSRPAEEISLLEIVEAVEGPIVLNRCLLRQGMCDRDAECTVHPVWREVQEKMRGILGNVTLKQLAGK
jgi:Rrf2 family transcriptional regulator, iron-sulfur cluster assembly transcription factor